ncbi:hypothetical protein [Lacipirellula sp.]|uniref:hypothetical protein n=1 Tax=Lacipirellula sp. TaxID=2691419 RepID=UPI003D14E7A0
MERDESLEAWAGNDRVSAMLQKMLEESIVAGGGHLGSHITNNNALGKAIQASAANYRKFLASSKTMWSVENVNNLMRALAEALNDAVVIALERADLDERQRTHIRHDIVDETTRLFFASFDKQQAQVTEDRAKGISALDQRLLENEEQE